MAKRKQGGLGKGLDALFGDAELRTVSVRPGKEEDPAAAEGEAVRRVDIEKIKPNANQPRKTFDPKALEDLAASIREHGVIQPVVVRRTGEMYELVAGERRWRAARMAGLKQIPVLVRDLSDEEQMLLAIIENMQREDLNPMEEAEGLDRMIRTYGLTQTQVSKSVGKSRPYITNALRLLKLPDPIREMVAEGKMTGGHARAVLSVEDPGRQMELARRIVDEGLSVRSAEELASGRVGKRAKPRPRRKDPAVQAVETELREVLGTRVGIRQLGNKGRIEIEYFSREELDRLIDLLRSLR